MSRLFLLLPVLAAVVLLAGCPDLYPQVRDVEFEGGGFVTRSGGGAFADSPIRFPSDWSEKPRSPGTRTITDSGVARALAALGSRPYTPPKKLDVSITTCEGPRDRSWYYRWLDAYGRRVRRTSAVCPICLDPLCPHNPCLGFGGRAPSIEEREAWKLRMKNRGVPLPQWPLKGDRRYGEGPRVR